MSFLFAQLADSVSILLRSLDALVFPLGLGKLRKERQSKLTLAL
jgi:hypothetical protein